MKPRENCNISFYKYPNEISQDVPDRARTVLFVVKFSNFDDETGTRGSPYNFNVLNSPVIGHRGKKIINSNW